MEIEESEVYTERQPVFKNFEAALREYKRVGGITDFNLQIREAGYILSVFFRFMYEKQEFFVRVFLTQHRFRSEKRIETWKIETNYFPDVQLSKESIFQYIVKKREERISGHEQERLALEIIKEMIDEEDSLIQSVSLASKRLDVFEKADLLVVLKQPDSPLARGTNMVQMYLNVKSSFLAQQKHKAKHPFVASLSLVKRKTRSEIKEALRIMTVNFLLATDIEFVKSLLKIESDVYIGEARYLDRLLKNALEKIHQ